MALPGVTEESWTQEVKDKVDQFILNSSITTLVLYVDAQSKLRAKHAVTPVVGTASCVLAVVGVTP